MKDVTPSKRVGGLSRRVSGYSGRKRTTGAWWYSSGLSGCGDASRDTVEDHLTLGEGIERSEGRVREEMFQPFEPRLRGCPPFGEHVDVRIDLIRSPIVDPIGAAPEQ